MERKAKFAPNEYYHLYSRGVEKRKIFIDFKNYQRFMALMYIMNQEKPFHFANFLKFNKISEIYNEKIENPLVSILSYTLMPNHFHILIYEHTEGGISKFMMKLLTAYSMYFNTKYKRSGPLFLHPFRSRHISEEAQYLWIFSYISLNPLKILDGDFKYKIKNRSVAEKFLKSYQYSSYLEYGGESRSQSKILDLSMIPDYLLNTNFTTKKYEKWFKDYQEYQGLPSIS